MADSFGNEGMTSLWQSVLLQLIKDIQRRDTSPAPLAPHEAESWVGAFPDQNFREVCYLAGIDPNAAHEWFRQLIRDERAKREAKEASRKALRKNNNQRFRRYQSPEERPGT